MTKDKPLIEEVVEWINPWGDKESAIPTRKVAEAVKKLKEDILFRKEFAQNEDEDIVLRDLLIDIDKIMGNFNQDVKKDKGCGCTWYDSKENKLFACISTHLCPKCEVGLKEDKQ